MRPTHRRRPVLDPLEARLSLSHHGGPFPMPPPAAFFPPVSPPPTPGYPMPALTPTAGDQAGSIDFGPPDGGSAYPGDFPRFVPIYPCEVDYLGPAF